MNLRFRDCRAEEQRALTAAAQVAASRLQRGVCGLMGLDALRTLMQARLAGTAPLTVECSDCEDLPADGYAERGNGRIGFCRTLFRDGQERLNAVFWHELVHSCGGTELDAESLENYCFTNPGATRPTPGDFRRFREGTRYGNSYAGQFVIWNPQTGMVYVLGRDGHRHGTPLGLYWRNPAP